MERDEASWMESVAAAGTVADAGAATAALLAEAAALAGATGAFVVISGERRPHATWGTVPDGAEALLAPGRCVRLDDGAHALYAVALRARDAEVGLLALVGEADAWDAGLAACPRLALLATVLALVVENDRLFEEARRARQARDHFLVAIHHELRTPATAVLLNTGLLRSGLVGTLPPRLQGAVEMLETDVQELVRVAGNVLDLGSLSAGVQPAGDELVRPREAVIEQLRRVEPAAKQKGLTLAVHLPRSLPVVQTDPERFGRILLHLFANAVKFTDEGRIDVYLERTTRPTPRGRREQVLMVRVVDTGRGMPVEEIERVFEPFAQVDEGARTESRRRGLGLGLTLANRLAASIGGSIALESEAGRGTTATFTLPWRRAHG